MFSDEVLEKIFARPEIQKFSISDQSTIVDVFEQVLEEMGVNTDAAVSES